MKKVQIGTYCITLVILLIIFTRPTHAEIAWSGDVAPDSPTTWTLDTDVYIGKDSVGMLSITSSDAVNNRISYIGYSSGSTGEVTVDGYGSTWANGGGISVGGWGKGTLNITAGGTVSSFDGRIGAQYGSTGEVIVDGVGSVWTNNNILYVGSSNSSGMLNITNGGSVSNSAGYIGGLVTEITTVTVDGFGSKWSNRYDLNIGSYGTDMGNSLLEITNGGLVSVAGSLTIWENMNGFEDGSIHMATGGMLALNGQADSSLAEFLGLISGNDAIYYWDNSILNWIDIADATYGQDYTLTYITEGDLDGYTILTVPEPATLALLSLGGLLLRKRKT